MMEKQVIPQLRFSEFSERRVSVKVSDIAEFKSGGTPKKDNKNYWGGDISWISASSMQGKFYSKSERTLTNEGLRNGSKLTPKNTLLLLVRGSMLYNKIPIGITKANVAFNQDLKSLTPNSKVKVEYLYQWFRSKENKVLNMVVGTGIGAGKLETDDVKSLKVLLPSIPEQQKIASFLSDVDEKITKLTQKKALLEQYKKGVMQKIFNQELRFKPEQSGAEDDDEGNAFPDWEEKKLGDLGSTLNGLTGKTKEDFGRGKPYIQYKQIFDSSKINIMNCGLIDITNSDKQTKVQYGDVFFTTSSETPNEIGTASVLLDNVEELYLNSFCFGFRVDQIALFPRFSQFLFRSSDFRKKMIPLAQGSTRYNISKSSFLKLKVNLPSIEEQTKIANFLSDIDLKIVALNSQIENSKSFKKGLLQKMFV